ncbi:hypothetical protein PDJAM_G00103420 [Pangasius djambal]|uniref:Uncharacterized protein n=1 Tax=Pangasius djambal TaxID=1691987 RepID=A0ACC5Y0E7_9TELE|nr:hypothetical protein [Pangasius djambal]
MLQTISQDLLPFITTIVSGSITSGHNNLQDPNQSVFKPAHSTETALLAVSEKLHAKSAKLSSVLILLDLSAAFDTVNHKTLLSTLMSLGIRGAAWQWFASYLEGGLSYTALYNVLNFPVGVVPVTEVTAEDEDQLKHYTGNFGDSWDKLFVKAIRGGVGLPIAVQCVALPWQDEMCLRLMREVEELCAKNKRSNTHH